MGGVAVAAHAHFARSTEPGNMNGVADAVAGTGDMDAVLLGHGLQIDVVIRGHGVDIEQIVIQIAHRALGPDAVNAHCLKGQVGHNGINIVGQCLVNLQKDFLAGNKAS